MKWITNENKEYRQISGGMSYPEWIEWKDGFIEGDPKPNNQCSVKDLKKMGYVGWYRKDEI